MVVRLLENLRSNLIEKMDNQRRSLSNAVPIPQWMKSKMNNRFDLDQSAFSPTEMDDPFVYVNRMRSNSNTNTQTQTQTISSVTAQFVADKNQHDVSKHTTPCQKFLHGVDVNGAQKVVIAPSSKKLKSCGVDDGFKGEAAKCGTSILKVAHEMVTSRVVRGFNVQRESTEPEGFDPSKRRGSKSLPASPIVSPSTSPKARRRNKFFTPPYVDTESGKEGWVISTLLARRDVSHSLDVIAEKNEENVKKGISMADLKGSPRLAGSASSSESSVKVTPKPSEYREMNFLSPTSM